MVAIILDMDGVIVDSEPLHLRTIHDIFKKYGIRVTKKEYAERYAGTGAKHIIEGIFREHKIRMRSADINALIKRRTAHYQRLIKGRLKTTPGFEIFFRALKSRGIPAAISSGGHRINVVGSLRAVGIRPKDFEAIITVDIVPQRKPHPQLFLAAARALHAKPSECTVFEDTAAGVQAAKRGKMKCVALLTTMTQSKLRAAGADLIVKDFRDKKLWKWLGWK
jgi:HAD superfamily hydrolase (TIGR01509 family)